MAGQGRNAGAAGGICMQRRATVGRSGATTHCSDVRELRELYPKVRVQADKIYTHDGRVWASIDITAGMDMPLAMVADDDATPLALKLAKRMVMASKRSGGQNQFSRQLQSLDLPDQLQQLEQMRDNLHLRLSVDELSQYLSPMQFNRQFVTAFRLTAQKYVEQLRVGAAKPMLKSTPNDIQLVAGECGFG